MLTFAFGFAAGVGITTVICCWLVGIALREGTVIQRVDQGEK